MTFTRAQLCRYAVSEFQFLEQAFGYDRTGSAKDMGRLGCRYRNGTFIITIALSFDFRDEFVSVTIRPEDDLSEEDLIRTGNGRSLRDLAADDQRLISPGLRAKILSLPGTIYTASARRSAIAEFAEALQAYLAWLAAS